MSLAQLHVILERCDRFLTSDSGCGSSGTGRVKHNGYDANEWRKIVEEVRAMADSNNLQVKIESNGNVRLTRKGDQTAKKDKDCVDINFDLYGLYVRYWLSNRIGERPCEVDNIKCLEAELKEKKFILTTNVTNNSI